MDKHHNDYIFVELQLSVKLAHFREKVLYVKLKVRWLIFISKQSVEKRLPRA